MPGATSRNCGKYTLANYFFTLSGLIRILLLLSVAMLVVRKTYILFYCRNRWGKKLLTWSTRSAKFLISLRRENDDLFVKGKVRQKVAWQRIAEKFNLTSSVIMTGEQCSKKSSGNILTLASRDVSMATTF